MCHVECNAIMRSSSILKELTARGNKQDLLVMDVAIKDRKVYIYMRKQVEEAI